MRSTRAPPTGAPAMSPRAIEVVAATSGNGGASPVPEAIRIGSFRPPPPAQETRNQDAPSTSPSEHAGHALSMLAAIRKRAASRSPERQVTDHKNYSARAGSSASGAAQPCSNSFLPSPPVQQIKRILATRNKTAALTKCVASLPDTCSNQQAETSASATSGRTSPSTAVCSRAARKTSSRINLVAGTCSKSKQQAAITGSASSGRTSPSAGENTPPLTKLLPPLTGTCSKSKQQAAIGGTARRTSPSPAVRSRAGKQPVLQDNSTSTSGSSCPSLRRSGPDNLRRFFISEEEKQSAVPLRLHCKSVAMTTTERVPGDKVDSASSSTDCNQVLREVSKLFEKLHREAKRSLKGRFSIDNLYVTEDGRVKLSGECLKLCRKTKERVQKDLCRLSDELRRNVFDGRVPEELSYWLDVMRDFPQLKLSVRFSAALMNPWNRVSLHNWMFMKLKNIERLSELKYDSILKRLPYSFIWKDIALANLHLFQCYFGEDRSGRRLSHYSNDVKGLIRFIRNVVAHMSEYCVRHGSCVFKESDIPKIISSAFPIFFVALQQSMEIEGELEEELVKTLIR